MSRVEEIKANPRIIIGIPTDLLKWLDAHDGRVVSEKDFDTGGMRIRLTIKYNKEMLHIHRLFLDEELEVHGLYEKIMIDMMRGLRHSVEKERGWSNVHTVE